MNRRKFLAASATFTLLTIAAARADEDYVEAIVDWLQKQGYADISVTRTLLGRARIIAVNSKGKRELVCNPRTGEILRDVLIDPDGGMSPPTQSASSGSSGSRSSSSGNNNDEDDGDHSGHGGGGDDDNSGHGSSGSGHDDSDDNSGHGSGDD